MLGGATWAPANLGEQRTSGSVSTRARSPCAHEAASGAASRSSSGNHAHGGRTSAEAGGGLDADGLAMINFEVTAEEIADKEIGLWKLRTVPLPKTDDPLMEWKLCGDKNVCPFLGRLARRVLAVPATSASPERLFSTAGNQMTKKRCGLTCDNLETLVYLHEVWPKTREWEARKKLRVV